MRFRTGCSRTRQLERPPHPDHPQPHYPRIKERQRIQDAFERIDEHFSKLAVSNAKNEAVITQKLVNRVNSSEQKVADVAQLQNEQNSGMPLIYK